MAKEKLKISLLIKRYLQVAEPLIPYWLMPMIQFFGFQT
jgi:hypothetical protein